MENKGTDWIITHLGALIQVRQALEPDGVFVGAILGGDTLFELRYVIVTKHLLCMLKSTFG